MINENTFHSEQPPQDPVICGRRSSDFLKILRNYTCNESNLTYGNKNENYR